MATITGLTAERMLIIEGASVVDGEVRSGNLFLTKFDGTEIAAGPVVGPPGPPGPMGPGGGYIPGEVRLWSGDSLPPVGSFGTWVWADGASYPVAAHPLAATYISSAWRTFAGASDPGAPNFRVPDFRGLVPAGMDAMPGGARANRMTRAVAITIAAKTGEEQHIISIAEMPAHTHSIDGFQHNYISSVSGGAASATIDFASTPNHTNAGTAKTNGGGTGHENVQPTVFVPYIVCLDG